MNKELTEKLYKKYPKIFVQHDLDMRQTCMCWGFECNDGWYWLINSLCDSIQNYIENNKHCEICQVETIQVKEKFGSLNFYFTGGDEYIGGMVHLAENQSYDICENCGSTNNIKQTDGWIKTLCENCIK